MKYLLTTLSTSIEIVYYQLCFSLKKMRNIFLPYKYSGVNFVYVLVSSIDIETAFSCYLENYIDFKYDSISFHKQRKEPANHKHLDIVPLKRDSDTGV